MDERELANSLLNMLDGTAAHGHMRHVNAIRLAVGGRRSFDLARLRGVFAEVVQGTVAEGAELTVQVLPVERHCQNCGTNFKAGAEECPCPECGFAHTEPVGGEELRLVEIEVEEEAS